MAVPEHTSLRPQLGLQQAVAVVAGSMLGVGILLNPAVVARETGSPWSFLALWASGGLIALCGAAAYGRLGRHFPHAGGDYVYLREGLGGDVGHTAGHLLGLAVFPGSAATLCAAQAQYQMPVLLGPLGYAADGTWLGISEQRWLGCLFLWLVTLVNAGGARLSGRVQLLLTGSAASALAALALGAMASAPAPPPVSAGDAAGITLSGACIAMLAVYFAYSGWNAVSYLGSELVEAERNLGRALLAGTGGITALYLLLCGGYLRALGLDGVAAQFNVGAATAEALLGEAARVPMTLLLTLAVFGTINGTVLGGARLVYAMAQDRVLPRRLSGVHPGSGAPTGALWFQAVVGTVLLLSGTFGELMALTSLAMVCLGALTTLALLVLHRRGAVEATRSEQLACWVYMAFSGFVVTVTLLQAGGLLRAGGDAEGELRFAAFGLVAVLVLHGALRVMRRARP